MKMICDVPDEVIKNVRMGTWCGSSVVEKMIANGTPLCKFLANLVDFIEEQRSSDKYGEEKQ